MQIDTVSGGRMDDMAPSDAPWDEPDDLFADDPPPSLEMADVLREFGPAYRLRTIPVSSCSSCSSCQTNALVRVWIYGTTG